MCKPSMGLLRVRFPGKNDKTKAVCGAPELSPAKDARQDAWKWEHKDSDIEMEDLFPKAVISERRPPTIGSDRGPSKRDLSMLKKLMRRRGHSSPLDEFSDKIRRNFLRESTVRAAPPKGCNMTPDLVSERGYDSDAQFISTPIASDRSPESTRTINLLESIRIDSQCAGEITSSDMNEQSPITTAGNFEIPYLATAGIEPCLEERMECATPSDQWSQTRICEDETGDIPSARLQRSSSLMIPKRRKATDCPPMNARRRSLFATNNLQPHAKAKAQSGFVVQRNTTTQSKFTEIFELGNLGSPARLRHPTAGNSRRVSVAWMSDGRRVGYGYSFVHSDGDGGTTHDVSFLAANQPASGDTNCGREASSGRQQDLQTQEPRYGKILDRRDGSQSPQSREHGQGLDDPARKLSLWSRFPGRTRGDRKGLDERQARRGRRRIRGFDGVVVGAKAPGRQEGNRWHESTKENFPVRGNVGHIQEPEEKEARNNAYCLTGQYLSDMKNASEGAYQRTPFYSHRYTRL
jgi:hypothetical protein